MRSLACCFLILPFAAPHVSAQQQQAVVVVSQVEMFKTSGTVNGAATSESGTETTTSAQTPTATKSPTPAKPTTAGGTITTGADGAASLMLGEGAETGGVRMGPDTSVKLPDAAEKGHSLEMLKGSLFLKIDASQLKQKDGAEFKLKTPAALLAVKGTQFFSRTENGTDTVGVHEGSVELTEPTTGQKLTLTTGQAAEVSPGVLSAMRAMTAAELGTADTYALADLSPIPLAVFLGMPGAKDPLWAWVDGKVQNTVPSWTAWRRLNASLWLPQPTQASTQMTADGGLLFTRRASTIVLRLAPRRGEPARDALGVSVRPLIPAKEIKALRFRMRQAGYTGIILHPNTYPTHNSTKTFPLNANDPAWKVYQLPMPALSRPGASPDSKDLEYTLGLGLPSIEQKYNRALRKFEPDINYLLEIKDFELLVLP